jgi:hypothetical protein
VSAFFYVAQTGIATSPKMKKEGYLPKTPPHLLFPEKLPVRLCRPPIFVSSSKQKTNKQIGVMMQCDRFEITPHPGHLNFGSNIEVMEHAGMQKCISVCPAQ